MDGRKILKKLTEMKLKMTGGILQIGGYSMIPLLVTGDEVRLMVKEKYSIGDIVVCIDRRARLLVHRIIDIETIEKTDKIENNAGTDAADAGSDAADSAVAAGSGSAATAGSAADGNGSVDAKSSTEYIYVTKGDNAVAAEYIEDTYCMGKVIEARNKGGKLLTFGEPGEHELKIVEYSKKVNEIYKCTRDPNEAYASDYNIMIYNMAPDNIKEYVYKAQNFMIQKAKEFIAGKPEPNDETFVYTRDFYKLLVNHRVVNILSPLFIDECGRYSKIFRLAKAQNLAAARRRLEWSIKITKAFDDSGIRYAVYKGITISHFAYGDPLLRECDDIDILIVPRDIEKAHKIMTSLGFAQAAHDGKTYVEEHPLMEYMTHLTPYVIPGAGITVELHTALYIAEWHTEEIIARRQRIDVGGYEFYALSDEDIYICQLYTTAVDDFGCANMSYEEDPNIFLQLKFRNYIDIILIVKYFSGISFERVIELGRRYDILFYLYLALDYTCKIFDITDETETVFRLRQAVKEAEKIDGSMYEFPIDAKSCLLSPFKMKMNGAALVRLRDAYYMSQRWRVKQEIFRSGKYIEMREGGILEYSSGIGRTLYSDGKLTLKVQMPIADTKEYVILLRRMSDTKYMKPGDYCFEAKFMYFDLNKFEVSKGTLYIDSELPWEKRIELLCGIIKDGTNKTKLRIEGLQKEKLKISNTINNIDESIYFEVGDELREQKYKFIYFSAFVFETHNGIVQKINKVTYPEEEHLKIIVD